MESCPDLISLATIIFTSCLLFNHSETEVRASLASVMWRISWGNRLCKEKDLKSYSPDWIIERWVGFSKYSAIQSWEYRPPHKGCLKEFDEVDEYKSNRMLKLLFQRVFLIFFINMLANLLTLAYQHVKTKCLATITFSESQSRVQRANVNL